MAHLEDLVHSFMPEAVWKSCAPLKCKHFAWLILQYRVWTTDWLQRTGLSSLWGLSTLQEKARVHGAASFEVSLVAMDLELPHLLAWVRLGGHFNLGQL
jgi:hypothetical protein